MSKVEKRLRKSLGKVQNSLVLGLGFGLLEPITGVFKSVFVINDSKPELKLKNLIYKENFNDISMITDISVIFIDRDKIHLLDNIQPLWYRYRPQILIEGDEVITREFSGPLYKGNYRAVEKAGLYHVWKYKE